MKTIIFKTDTVQRSYMCESMQHDKQEGPFHLINFELLLEEARKKGYQLVTKTETGTYYLKCHLEDIDRTILIETLDRNYFLDHKPRSTSYLLPPP